jgi:hypothetical protein
VTPATGGIAIVMLVVLVGIAVLLIWWAGRDRRARGTAIDVAYPPRGCA